MNGVDVLWRPSTGGTWDNGGYFISGEFGKAASTTTLLADSGSWYLTGGIRLGLWTPYANYLVTAILQNTAQSQHTLSAGVRYDILSNLSLKLQWDHTATQCNTPSAGTCDGLFGNTTAAFR